MALSNLSKTSASFEIIAKRQDAQLTLTRVPDVFHNETAGSAVLTLEAKPFRVLYSASITNGFETCKWATSTSPSVPEGGRILSAALHGQSFTDYLAYVEAVLRAMGNDIFNEEAESQTFVDVLSYQPQEGTQTPETEDPNRFRYQRGSNWVRIERPSGRGETRLQYGQMLRVRKQGKILWCCVYEPNLVDRHTGIAGFSGFVGHTQDEAQAEFNAADQSGYMLFPYYNPGQTDGVLVFKDDIFGPTRSHHKKVDNF